MTFEICADTIEACVIAEKYKVKRVELCSALSVGGLTPSKGLMEACVAIGGVEVHAMIRHLEGGFVYSDDDIKVMLKDIRMVKETGGHGVVFGCLTANNQINLEQSKLLFELAKELKLEVTFHRAFDFCSNPVEALEQLIDVGFDRLLTSGTHPTAEQGADVLKDIVAQANGRIQIMAASGVSPENAIRISETGVDALHFTTHDKVQLEKDLGMGTRSVMTEQKTQKIVEQF